MDGTMTMPDAPGCAAVAVAAGADHTCALTGDGSVYCWGRGTEGQIGIDPLTYQCSTNTVYCQKVPGRVALSPMRALGVGASHTCAANSTQAYCWGKNTTGQYGNGTIVGVTRPMTVPERAGATAIDGGAGHTCSLAGGALACSGANAEGQVGNMSVAIQPTAVTVMTGVDTFALDSTTSCAIDGAKQLWCWGRNVYKTIDQSAVAKTLPTRVDGINDVEQIAVGSDHLCAVVGDRRVTCWGRNSKGQLGNGETSNSAESFTTAAVGGVVEVVASGDHTCVRTQGNGNVYCFGDGYSAVPVPITTGATRLTAGDNHDCAIFSDGTVRCWGDQQFGQLGNGTDVGGRTQTPQLAKLCP